MPYIEWSDDYMIGHRLIDQEHWGLFALINELHDKVQSGAQEPSVGATIDALVDYVNVHFEHEELLMESCGYPDLDRHKQAHAGLRRMVMAFKDAYEHDPERFEHGEFVEFLGNWLSEHILKIDIGIIPHLQAGRPASRKM